MIINWIRCTISMWDIHIFIYQKSLKRTIFEFKITFWICVRVFWIYKGYLQSKDWYEIFWLELSGIQNTIYVCRLGSVCGCESGCLCISKTVCQVRYSNFLWIFYLFSSSDLWSPESGGFFPILTNKLLRWLRKEYLYKKIFWRILQTRTKSCP